MARQYFWPVSGTSVRVEEVDRLNDWGAVKGVEQVRLSLQMRMVLTNFPAKTNSFVCLYSYYYFYTRRVEVPHSASWKDGANLSPSNTSHSCIEAGARKQERGRGVKRRRRFRGAKRSEREWMTIVWKFAVQYWRLKTHQQAPTTSLILFSWDVGAARVLCQTAAALHTCCSFPVEQRRQIHILD